MEIFHSFIKVIPQFLKLPLEVLFIAGHFLKLFHQLMVDLLVTHEYFRQLMVDFAHVLDLLLQLSTFSVEIFHSDLHHSSDFLVFGNY